MRQHIVMRFISLFLLIAAGFGTGANAVESHPTTHATLNIAQGPFLHIPTIDFRHPQIPMQLWATFQYVPDPAGQGNIVFKMLDYGVYAPSAGDTSFLSATLSPDMELILPNLGLLPTPEGDPRWTATLRYYPVDSVDILFRVTGFREADADNDGMIDLWEQRYGVDNPDEDADQDGLTNLEEFQQGTFPRQTDNSTPQPNNVSLTLTTSGPGRVTSNTGAIDCGTQCAAEYPSNAVVTLTAMPGTGARFAGWRGGCSGTHPTCILTMNDARQVTAVFDSFLPLNITTNGPGRVTSNTGAIDCGTQCAAEYPLNTLVTLTATATPSTSTSFGGWSGDCTGTQPTCTLTMSESRQVTAVFDSFVPLNVTTSGPGWVTSDTGAIDCGTQCAAEYPLNTLVTLTATATPSTSTRFGGWSGDCTGTALTCTLTMSEARQVMGRFSR